MIELDNYIQWVSAGFFILKDENVGYPEAIDYVVDKLPAIVRVFW